MAPPELVTVRPEIPAAEMASFRTPALVMFWVSVMLVEVSPMAMVSVALLPEPL
jgi:hypothetical protein